MENNKISISLTTVIMIAVIIVALILGFFSYAIYNNFNKKTEIENDKIVQSAVDSLQLSETSNNSDKQDSTNKSINTNTTFVEKDSSSNLSESNSVTGKSSSKQSPLSIGDWGIVSTMSTGGYVDVPVSVIKVTRGASAAQEVKNYCENGSSIYKYEDAKDGMEWAVVEYKVDLTKMDKNSSVDLYSKITGTGDNTSIKYNGYTYIISTINISHYYGYTKGEIVSRKFAVQLPIGCTDYVIVLGPPSTTSYPSNIQAYFIGK